MSVTIARGRSGSGKSRYLTAHIKNLITNNPLEKVIVITAGSLTFETERSIINNCDVSGILGLQVFSIQRLAYAILENTEQFMTNADKAVVCKKALLKLDSPFHGAADTPDFISCLSDLVSRLKDYNQTPKSLRAVETADTALKKKLSDTADVLEQYESLCGSKKDSADMYALAAARASEAQFLKNAHVIIDGMDSYSPSVMLLITKLAQLCKTMHAAFRHQGTGSDADLFASELNDMKRFSDAVRRAGKQITFKNLDSSHSRYSNSDLAFLERNLYSYPYKKYDKQPEAIKLFEAQTVENEVDMIAANIIKEVASGRKYSDIAIVAGNLKNYIPTLKMKLGLSRIPFFIDERRTLADNTFFDFVYKSMSSAWGEKLFLPSYAFSRYSPLSDDEKNTLRKYIDRYSYQGWHFSQPFRFGDDATEAERIRHKVMQPLDKLEKGLAQSSAKSQTEAVIKFLSECDAQEKLQALCESLEQSGLSSQREYFSQVFEKTLDVLSGISEIFGDMPILPKELIELFKTGCEATKIALIPPSTDEVGIFDISLVRLKNIDVLFAAGVQDGVWPAKASEPGILSESERSALFDVGVDIGVTDLSAEKLKIYTALNKPTDKLYISYNCESPPSVLIDRIKRIFPLLETDTQTQLCTECTDSSVVLSELSSAINEDNVSQSLLNTCAVLMQNPEWKTHARSVLTRTNAAGQLSKQTAVSLYGGIKCSATRIENYYKCPYSHFLSRGIKAQVKREYVGDSMDTGTFIHLALDIFAQTLIHECKDIKLLSKEEVSELMQSSAQKAAEQHEDAKLLEDERFASLYGLLARELISTAQRIRSHFINTQAEILSSEQEFSGYKINTKFGDVTITGKIDRIDRAGSYFRVVDYKSSKKVFSLGDFSSGVSLQLPIYIEAAKRLLEKQGHTLYPAGGYYMEIGEGYLETEKDLAADKRLFGVSLNDPQVLCSFSDSYENGSYVAIDQRVTKSGALHGSGKNKHFISDELDVLLEYTNTLIKEAAEGIYEGNTNICPVDSSDVCKYCDFKSVCLKDTGFESNISRQPQPFTKQNLEQEQ